MRWKDDAELHIARCDVEMWRGLYEQACRREADGIKREHVLLAKIQDAEDALTYSIADYDNLIQDYDVHRGEHVLEVVDLQRQRDALQALLHA